MERALGREIKEEALSLLYRTAKKKSMADKKKKSEDHVEVGTKERESKYSLAARIKKTTRETRERERSLELQIQ